MANLCFWKQDFGLKMATFEDIMDLCEDKISFLSNKQAIFLAVSKFCVEAVSQNFLYFK